MSIPKSISTINFTGEDKKKSGLIFLAKCKGKYDKDFFWNSVIPHRIELYEKHITKLSDKKLVNTSPYSIKNDVTKHKFFRIKNLIGLLCVLLSDDSFKGDKKHIYVGYTFTDFKTIFDLLDKNDLRKAESLFKGQNNGESLLAYLNEFLDKINDESHPFGKIQLTEDWEIESSRMKKVIKSKRWQFAFDLMSTGLLIVLSIVTVNKLLKPPHLNENYIVERRIETGEKLGKLFQTKKWVELRSESLQAIENKELKDIGLLYMGKAEIHQPVGRRNPSYYIFQIDPKSRLYTHGINSLEQDYRTRYNGKMYSERMNSIFNHLESKGEFESPLWFFLKIRECIHKNMLPKKNLINVDMAYPELAAYYKKMKISFSESYDFERMRSAAKIRDKPKNFKKYSHLISFDKFFTTQTVVFQILHRLCEVTNHPKLSEDHKKWSELLAKLKSNSTPEIITDGFDLLGLPKKEYLEYTKSIW